MKKNMNNVKRNSLSKNKIILIIVIVGFIFTGIFIYFFMNYKKEKSKEKKPEIKIQKRLTIFDEESNSRPIAIMIDNNVGNELHEGLQESYLNYEIIVEGGLTRIMAIFKDKNIESIGPVRSSRHYFLDYALESDCIYTHFGWSKYAKAQMEKLGVNNINGLYDSAPFWRVNTIAAPHNVFTSIPKIYEYAKTKNYNNESQNWQLFNYSVDEVYLNKEEDSDVIIANKVIIPYSSQIRSYTYNNEKKTYLRFMNEKPHIDAKTREQYNYKNIIIEYVKNYSMDKKDRQDLNTVGSGTGYYITNGYAKKINWEKLSRNEKTKYTYSDGTEIILNDGNTFIQIVPLEKSVTIE